VTDSPSLITISTTSHLYRVQALFDSLRRHEPRARLTCYLAEREAPASPDPHLTFIPMESLPLPGGRRFSFQYTAFDLCSALKAPAILDQFDRHGAGEVLYIDSDQWVCAPFLALLAPFRERGDVLLTPHFIDRARDDANYARFLRSGFFNAGFIGARHTPDAREMLAWLARRCAQQCLHDYTGGIHGDQGWLNLAAAAFHHAVVPVDHPGINVGHWNLRERNVAQTSDGYTVNGEPLALMHFSGFHPQRITTHDHDPFPVTPALERLAGEYARDLAQARTQWPTAVEWSYARFDDGEHISRAMREAVRAGLVTVADPYGDRPSVTATLDRDDPEALLRRNQRDMEFHYLRTRAADADAHRLALRRIRTHPVFGRLLTLWNRTINPDL